MKIAILDDWSGTARASADWAGLERDYSAEITIFRENLPDVTALTEFQVICIMRERMPFDADAFAALPALKLLVTTGPRNLSVDMDAARAAGVTVCATRSRKTTTSEFAMTLILAQSRRLVAEVNDLRAGGFQGGLGRDLAGLRLGLVGLGSIGQQMAALARAFGMEVAAWSPNLTADRAEAGGASFAPSLPELAAQSDVMSVHMVLSERSRGLIGAEAFAALPEGALFVNTSRAGLVDRAALFDGLRAGRPASAAIDVYETEPLPADDPWRAAAAEFGDRLLLSPHLGYVTQTTWQQFYGDTVEDIRAWAEGSPIRVL